MITLKLALPLFFYLFPSIDSAADAPGIMIYKEYYTEMPFADIQRQSGVVEVTGLSKVRLMRPGKRFAEAEWSQFFAFGMANCRPKNTF